MKAVRRVGGLPFPVLVLLLQAATWFAMFTSETTWLVSWRQAVDNAAGTVVIVGSLLAGLTAGIYSSVRGSTLADLVAASARPVRGWLGPAVRLWVAAVVSLVIAVGVLTLRAGFMGVPLAPRQLIILPVAALALAVHAIVGLVIGLRVSPRAASLLAALVSFGLFILAGDHLAPPSFETGGVTGPMYGEQYRSSSIAALCGFAVLSAVVLSPWVLRGPGTSGRWAVSIGGVAAIVVLAQFTWPDVESRLEPSPVRFRCAGSSPEVCVVAERPTDDLESISRRLGELARPLVDVGATIPTRWRQDLWGQPLERASGKLIIGDDEVEDSDLVRSLVEPAACPQVEPGNDPVTVFSAKVRILNWLVVRNRLDQRAKVPRWFSSAESDRWVRATYAQLKGCDLDAIRKP